MALRREVGTRTRDSCRGCGMSDPKAVMQNLWMYAVIAIGVLLQQVGGDLCNDYMVVVDEWRSVSSTAETNHCDNDAFEVGKWYAFQLKGQPSNIPTECIKNNNCGAQIPMRLDLNTSLPEEGKVIEASLCGSYNILGKYDCCVLRTPVRISVCSGVMVYQFPTPPIDRCSVAICAQDPNEPPPSRSLIARTGDIADDVTTSTETTTTLDAHSSTLEDETVSLSIAVSTDSTSGPESSDTSTVEGDTVSLTATISTDSTSEPQSSDTSDAKDPITPSGEAQQGTTPLSSDEPTTDIYGSPASPETTDTTDLLEDATSSDASEDRSTSDATEKILIVETQSTVATDTTPDPSFFPTETDINNAPPMDFQQTTTDQPSDHTTEFLNKTTEKLQEVVEPLDSNVTTISPQLDSTDETSVSLSPKEVSSEAVTSSDVDGSGELRENTTAADDTILVPTSLTSTTRPASDDVTESAIPASAASQDPGSTDLTTSTTAPPSDDSETSPTDGTTRTTAPPGDDSETSPTDEETAEPTHDDSIHSSPVTSDPSTSGSTYAETSTDAEPVATPVTTAAPLPSRTPTVPLLLTTTVRPLDSGVNDLILIETIRFVFRGNHSQNIYFSSKFYEYMFSFLTRAVKEYQPDSGSHWNYTLFDVFHPVVYDNVTTYVDAKIQHTAKDGIIKVFDKLNLESYLLHHGNLTLIAKCRASASCEIDQPTQASTQSVFERNSPIFLTLIIICSVCLVVLLCIAVYIKCFRRGVYVAEEAEATNLADRRPYFNVNPSPFTDEQIMKDEVAMEKGEKPDKVDNSSSCNGSDLIGGDSNTWVIPLDDAPVTSPVISNEDTKL